MSKIIQTTIDASGDVHLDFSGFVGRECQVEESRFREQLAALGLAVTPNIAGKVPSPLKDQILSRDAATH